MKGETGMNKKALLISIIIVISIIPLALVIIGLIRNSADCADCAAESRKSSLGFLNVFTGA